MAVMETVSWAFAIVYLWLIVETLFSSSASMMKKQAALEGRLIFLVYSLIVYYKDVSFNIFLFDQFINNPIKQAYGLLEMVLSGFFGLSMKSDPWFLFKYIIPLAFIYNFVNYWFSYGFGDKRIAKMVSFTAVVLYLTAADNILKEIFWWAIPVGGVPFGAGMLSDLVGFFPVADLMGTVLMSPTAASYWLVGSFLETFASNPLIFALILLVVLFALSILFYLLGRKLVTSVAEAGLSDKLLKASTIFLLVAAAFSLVSLFAISYLLYGSFTNFGAIISKMSGVATFLIALQVIALASEVLVFIAMYAMVRNFRKVFATET